MVTIKRKGFSWLLSLFTLFLIFAFGGAYYLYQFGLPSLVVLLDWVAICVLVGIYVVTMCTCVVLGVRRLTMRHVGLSGKSMVVEHAVVLAAAVACAVALVCIALV